jgi:hypothetical protein
VRAQEKIGQLEKMVMSLMNGKEGQPLVAQSLPSDPSQLPDSFGRISLENAQTNYVESSHWTAVLDGVCVSFVQSDNVTLTSSRLQS